MSTFQCIVASILLSISQLLPISQSIHAWALEHFLNWPVREALFLHSITFASFLALLVAYRHDWASIISGILRVVLFFKRPGTIDERMSFFLALSSIPLIVATPFLLPHIQDFFQSQMLLALLIYSFFGFAIRFIAGRNRKQKSMLGWNWLDALLIGILQIGALIPGLGRVELALLGAHARNFHPEAVAKFTIIAGAPVLLWQAWPLFQELHFDGTAPSSELSWMSLGISFVVAFFTSFLAIESFRKATEKSFLNGYWIYRLLTGVALGVFLWRSTI